jgi:BirA family biotin operon repressor/biotin-[acetyl-CoA-carboxylase] ligase
MGWPVQVVDVTGSTNTDLVAAARAGDRGPRVLAARSQTAGRGRLGRRWQSAPGASLAVSVLWAPAVPQAAWTWLPLVVGLGVLDASARSGAVVGVGPGAVALKWPNDVVVVEEQGTGADGGAPDGARRGLSKLAGILSEVVASPAGPVVVLGVGINLADPDLDTDPDPDLDHDQDHDDPDLAAGAAGGAATSLARAVSRDVTFEELLPVLVTALRVRLQHWEAAGGDAVVSGVAQDYRARCTTIGRRVRASTPGGERQGIAVDLDADGALLLDGPRGLPVRVSAGDVEHVR